MAGKNRCRQEATELQLVKCFDNLPYSTGWRLIVIISELPKDFKCYLCKKRMTTWLGNSYVNEFNLIIARYMHISKHHLVPINICTHSLSMKNKTKINDWREALVWKNSPCLWGSASSSAKHMTPSHANCTAVHWESIKTETVLA